MSKIQAFFLNFLILTLKNHENYDEIHDFVIKRVRCMCRHKWADKFDIKQTLIDRNCVNKWYMTLWEMREEKKISHYYSTNVRAKNNA